MSSLSSLSPLERQRLEKWLTILVEGDREMSKIAADKLGQIGHPAAVPALIEALDRRPPEVSAAAARALGLIGDKQAVPALITAMLEHHDVTVNTAAAEALGDLRDPRAVDALAQVIDAYNNKYQGDRFGRVHSHMRGLYIAAIRALESIGTREARNIARRASRP